MKTTTVVRAPRFAVTPLAAAVATLIGVGGVPAAGFGQDLVGIEEIVVTASRRETTVQELPFNIAAVSGDTLERQRLTNLSEFSRWVPGLTVVEQGARASNLMTVRGLNVRSINASEFLDNSSGRTVATYLGEIPLYVDFKMKDLERVEVLLGPQGTLYGEGTLGGAVRYIPATPDTQEFSADFHGDLFSLSHSSGTGYEAGAVFNVPLVDDRLAFRGAFSYFDDPGFIDYPYLVQTPGVSNPQPDLDDPAAIAANLRRESDVDWEQTFSSRLALLWNITDALEATFNYYFQNQEVGGRTVNHRHSFGTDRYESGLRFVEPNERDNELLSVELVADLGFAELTSATGLSQYDQVGQRDQTDLLLSFVTGYENFPSFSAYTRETVKEDRLNEEIRLVSTGTGPLNWIGGLFYNDYETDSLSSEFTPGFTDFLGLSLPSGDLEYLELNDESLTERAVFGEIGYRFTERWQATIGGRWFEYDYQQSNVTSLPIVDVFGTDASSVEDDGFLTKLNASYDFTDDVMGYVTLSEGYRIGGSNGVPACLDPLPPGQNACALPDENRIDPDTTTNFEVGVHSTFQDGALVLNAAIYRIDWDDVQTLGTTVNGAVPITVNGGEARSQGVELSMQTRGGEHWSFSGSYSYNDATLTTFSPGLVDGAADAFPGDRLSGTPEHQGSFFANYNRALPNGWALDVGYGFTFRSNILTKVGLRNDGETLGGYTVHNLAVGVSEDRWSASLYADNLTDKFAETGVRLDQMWIGDVGGFALRSYYRHVLRPRSVGLEFRYRLGE